MNNELIPEDPEERLLHPITGEELPASTSWYEWLQLTDRELCDEDRWAIIQAAARYTR
jgi:hypothetical protein